MDVPLITLVTNVQVVIRILTAILVLTDIHLLAATATQILLIKNVLAAQLAVQDVIDVMLIRIAILVPMDILLLAAMVIPLLLTKSALAELQIAPDVISVKLKRFGSNGDILMKEALYVGLKKKLQTAVKQDNTYVFIKLPSIVFEVTRSIKSSPVLSAMASGELALILKQNVRPFLLTGLLRAMVLVKMLGIPKTEPDLKVKVSVPCSI